MKVDRLKPHLLVLPEDDDWRQIVNGFLQVRSVNYNSLQVLDLARGWSKAFDSITDSYATRMRKYSECRIVLLIDFDYDTDRLEKNKNRIPVDLFDRVFVIGVLSKEPKDLCKETGMNLEKIGEELAKNCADNIAGLWDHALLRHNKPELERMIPSVKSFLFI
jgi:hypothetical protein